MVKFPVLLIDLDNTLYDFAAAMDKASNAVIRMIGTGDPKELIRACIFSPYGVENLQTLIDYLQNQGIEDKSVLTAACDTFDRTKREAITPFPGVVQCMQQIFDAGILIGVVTNATSFHAHERLSLIGVSFLIHRLFSPDTTGFKKPDPGMFHHAADVMGYPSHRICVLGDNLRNDIAPAQEAGMYGVHARYGDRLPVEFAGDTIADACIESFKDIIPILGLRNESFD
ncbi:MAG: HAD family hydrolase [Methanospirillum sp.]|uniref:HAD family hydrolase n=1 Tax=Methanospirillum sp. TaxID=45200 RepID=UPI00237064A1|nr:HAD family hydrolase [Methanospirillum sp.]MDD1730439.1 HAD family hydrolase [Methanospirillum sp.]